MNNHYSLCVFIFYYYFQTAAAQAGVLGNGDTVSKRVPVPVASRLRSDEIYIERRRTYGIGELLFSLSLKHVVPNEGNKNEMNEYVLVTIITISY